MNIETYDDHEPWLDRQHALLAELEEMGGIGHEPPPRVLPPLPWWKDQHRIDGEAQRVIEALRFVREVIKAVFSRLLRELKHPIRTGVIVALLMFLAAFAAGAHGV